MRKISLLFIILLAFIELNAQEVEPTEKKGFILISAGKNYESMRELAKSAANKLNYKLDFRGLIKNETYGLTFPKDTCEAENFEFPTYIARGRFDDGNYVSVEYTDAYEGFTPKLYILVVASFPKGSSELTETLSYVKQYYKNAYIKYADVYIGCMH